MLADTKTFSSFATDDLEATRAFYADTLGVRAERVDPMPLVELHLAGGRVMVYEKPDFVPATYTVLNFVVDDVDAAVDALAEKGVAFEIYDGFDQDEKGIARGQGGGPDIAWFRDPAGNILSVLEDA
jgi:catechol 2,3-dioxygenase-like lactoylglutathione lyase family enzyme